MYVNRPENIGEFREISKGNYFTYRKTDDPWAIEQGYPFIIDVLDGVRFANVKKTVAYVVVDEDEAGAPVVEKWSIKQLNYNR